MLLSCVMLLGVVSGTPQDEPTFGDLLSGFFLNATDGVRAEEVPLPPLSLNDTVDAPEPPRRRRRRRQRPAGTAVQAGAQTDGTCTPENAKLRRSWHEMEPSEQSSFSFAIASLFATPTWTQLVRDHASRDHIVHNDPDFFSTHRAFLVRVEDALESHGWSKGLPYYDTTAVKLGADGKLHWRAWEEDGAFWAAFGGFKTDGSCLDAPFDVPVIPDGSGMTCVTRGIRKTQVLFDRTAISEILENPDWTSFYRSAEAGFHARVHIGVGGSMRFIRQSAGDPVFYMHHAFTDMVWASWEAKHPPTDGSGTKSGGYCYEYDDLIGQPKEPEGEGDGDADGGEGDEGEGEDGGDVDDVDDGEEDEDQGNEEEDLDTAVEVIRALANDKIDEEDAEGLGLTQDETNDAVRNVVEVIQNNRDKAGEGPRNSGGDSLADRINDIANDLGDIFTGAAHRDGPIVPLVVGVIAVVGMIV